MPVCAALFDFDGTLADSFGAITQSTNFVRATYGLAPLSEEVVREYVGFGLTNLMQTLLPDVPTEEAAARYRDHHPTVMFAGTKLFPGVPETLAELRRRGLKLSVCSNKLSGHTCQLIEALGLGGLFDAVLGPNDVGKPKPDPAMLLEAIRRLGVPKSETVYVGDMAIDVHTGKAAGIPVWLVPGGAKGLEDPFAAGPDRVVPTFADLLGLLPAVPTK